MKQLNIQQIIEVLIKNQITFEAKLYDVGQDTNWDEIEFTLQGNHIGFTFHLDEDTHGANVQSHLDSWLFKIYSEADLLKIISPDRKMYYDPLE